MATLRWADLNPFAWSRTEQANQTKSFKNAREAFDFTRAAHKRTGVTEDMKRVYRVYRENAGGRVGSVKSTKD